MLAISFLPLLFSLALASPTPLRIRQSSTPSEAFANALSSAGALLCPRLSSDLIFPPSQTNLTLPPGQSPRFVTIGRGVQNYSCTPSGTWKSIGAVANLFDISPAVANLFDISCLVPTSTGSTISTLAFDAPFDPSHSSLPSYLGSHTFIPLGPAIAPKFDLSLTQADEAAFVVANRTASLVSPNDPGKDIDWLELASLGGGLARTGEDDV